MILKYVRPVIKRRDADDPLPGGPRRVVIDSSRADVSFIAGLITDKFCYHQPLYRQHRRLGTTASGSRARGSSSPTRRSPSASLYGPARLDPAQVASGDGRTPIKARRAGPGR